MILAFHFGRLTYLAEGFHLPSWGPWLFWVISGHLAEPHTKFTCQQNTLPSLPPSYLSFPPIFSTFLDQVTLPQHINSMHLLGTCGGRILSRTTEKDQEDEQVPGTGQAEQWHRHRRTCWEPRGEDWGVPCLVLPARSDPSVHRAPGTECSVVCKALMALPDCSFSSGPHLKQLFPSAPVPLPCTQGLHQCWTKEGNQFCFPLVQYHSNFYVKIAQPVLCSFISKEKHKTDFNWYHLSVGIIFTLSYSWLLSLNTRCLPPALTHSGRQTFLF